MKPTWLSNGMKAMLISLHDLMCCLVSDWDRVLKSESGHACIKIKQNINTRLIIIKHK